MAGRQAPVSWQQVNTERPRPQRRASPGVLLAARQHPRAWSLSLRGALVRVAPPATWLRWVPQHVVAAAQWLTTPSPRRAPLSASASSRRAALRERASEKRGEVPGLRRFGGESGGGSPVSRRNGRGSAACKRRGELWSLSGLGTHATLTCSTEKALPCQVKGKEKAEASPVGKSRRNRKWTSSAPLRC
ncbi:small lysine-rich protein 1 isoform X2 [Kogia breviceps]|uniref:small lysine-rich protein 1 isoform X2 n=1 Tax=Kogia breviceps TaxID=27615 RepID=UPI0034D17496